MENRRQSGCTYGGSYGFFDFISSLTIASTTGFRISRVTACSTSGLIFASTLATSSSIVGGEARVALSGDLACGSPATGRASASLAFSATWAASSRIASTADSGKLASSMAACVVWLIPSAILSVPLLASEGAGSAVTSHPDASRLAFATSASHGLDATENHESSDAFLSGSEVAASGVRGAAGSAGDVSWI